MSPAAHFGQHSGNMPSMTPHSVMVSGPSGTSDIVVSTGDIFPMPDVAQFHVDKITRDRDVSHLIEMENISTSPAYVDQGEENYLIISRTRPNEISSTSATSDTSTFFYVTIFRYQQNGKLQIDMRSQLLEDRCHLVQ
jgi:hypothetical protein